MNTEYGEDPTSPCIADITRYRAIGRVLDVGCAKGNNSLYFARRGYDVDALDIDGKALEMVGKKATELNVSINLLHEDIASFQPESDYDIILADRSLYFLPTYEAFKAAVLKLQEATLIGGIHTNTILSEENTVDPGPRLTMGRYSMFNLYLNNPNWESRHEWRTTDPLGQKFITLTAQRVRQ
jgi:SAM-dependent methyltransferase